MKVSVIIPVRNEETHIADLLESLSIQSKTPDEIVIVDGGSKDDTVRFINTYIAKGMPIKLIETDESLPGKGRNIAIANARNETIAMTDGGIILDKEWLGRLTAPFERDPSLEIVYGVYDYTAKSLFEECFAIVYVPAAEEMNGVRSNYPSLMSMALKRYVWERVGGFREDLRAAEDLIFFRKINRTKFKSAVAGDAIAKWRPRSSLKEAFTLSMRYASCSAVTGFHLARHVRKYLMYSAGLLLLFLGVKNVLWLILLLMLFS